jgi:hypothetical protein
MARQSEALSDETAAMRAIDLAMQRVDEKLTGKAKERVLRYTKDQVEERLPADSIAGRVHSDLPVHLGGGGSSAWTEDSVISGGGAGSRHVTGAGGFGSHSR